MAGPWRCWIYFWNKTSTCFRQFFCPSSGVFHCTHSNGICHTAGEQDPSWSCSQAVSNTCMTYTIAVCTVKNSWWWTEKLSETCRVLFQKSIWEISASSWFYYKNTNTPFENATTDGVVLDPSEFSITLACFPSITATQELVVPRSIPITVPLTPSDLKKEKLKTHDHVAVSKSVIIWGWHDRHRHHNHKYRN